MVVKAADGRVSVSLPARQLSITITIYKILNNIVVSAPYAQCLFRSEDNYLCVKLLSNGTKVSYD